MFIKGAIVAAAERKNKMEAGWIGSRPDLSVAHFFRSAASIAPFVSALSTLRLLTERQAPGFILCSFSVTVWIRHATIMRDTAE